MKLQAIKYLLDNPMWTNGEDAYPYEAYLFVPEKGQVLIARHHDDHTAERVVAHLR